MDRFQLRQQLESKSFEFSSVSPLLPYERYVVDRKRQESEGKITYEVLGSGGAHVTISSNEALPSQPFVILKEVTRQPTMHVYKALDVDTIGCLTEDF